jgi:hypothetical protein
MSPRKPARPARNMQPKLRDCLDEKSFKVLEDLGYQFLRSKKGKRVRVLHSVCHQ